MNRRQFLAFSALTLAGALGACGLPGGAGDQQNRDLAKQFLTERNGGTPVAVGAGGPNAPILGFVETIDGRKLTVRRPSDGSTATVELAEDAQVRKDIDIQLAEIKAGDSVTAFGSRQGEVFQADLLRVGDASADGEPAVITFTGAEASGPPGGQDQFAAGGPGGVLSRPLAGVVEAIDDAGIVVKDEDGASTTVTLGEGAKIQKPTQVAPAELAAGAFIIAIGERSGELFRATQVRIMPAPMKR